ncbi:MAG: phenylalanine--tRNA ligase subunit beta [Pseudomonadota bacterium]|nr:phenylalanine--tRNA ligase subunit beta [Pseudomonadota bacterium]
MKFTLSWLKYHLATDASLDEITDKLTMLGLEVEAVDDRAATFAPFLIGQVISARQHPNADRLRLCTVDTGGAQYQVVCGAPNARQGIKGVFAPIGSFIPGTEVTLKSSKIRGEESHGMLCSEKEMGISDEHGGIIELPGDAPIGEKWAAWSCLDDPVIEIALTPNRGDCASVRGIARDLAAAGLGELSPLPNSPQLGSFESPIKWRHDFPPGAETACPFVVGRYFRNVENTQSPAFIQDRLKAIGLRPISALVDITNWLTFDLGRPLHVFDADKISGDLVMRFARSGERIKGLDDQEYELDENMVVISDDRGPQGIGGVMGGHNAGCDDSTNNVFLEVALFDPIKIAEAGRRLGIMSDARYRFERGIDPQSVEWGCDIATKMILKFCGGEASELVSSGRKPETQANKILRPTRIKDLTGVDISLHQSQKILFDLGFNPKMRDGDINVTVPTWRHDIDGEADLVEEVLRIYGFDKIPEVKLEPEQALCAAPRNDLQRRAEKVRRSLSARGLVEAVTYSFIDSRHAAFFGGKSKNLTLSNPISSDLDVMRPSIIPSLLVAAARNQARGIPSPLFFEVGPQYDEDTPEGQRLVAAGLRSQNAVSRHWSAPMRGVDAIDAKADALSALSASGAPVNSIQLTRDAPTWYHPGRSGVLRLGKNVLGFFGELHPSVLEFMQAAGPIVCFEVFLDSVPVKRSKSSAKPMLEIPSLQPVYRDFAFIVDQQVDAEEVLKAVRNSDSNLIENVNLFDVYEGAGVEIGKKSLGIMVTLQPRQTSLTDREISAASESIVTAVEKKTGGSIR